MRTYDQFCPAARALDVVGDRWTLLIVRELLNRGPCRYTDLRYGLPGIATNLLADRLRELEANGIVVRESAPPPVATSLFRLTPRGEALDSVLQALGRWGLALLAETPEDAEFRSHWLRFPDATLRGSPRLILGLLMGAFDLAAARARGLEFDGDVEALRRVQPLAVTGVSRR